jgi:16S rRNA (uracil1498-N3)-methyltransferase
MRYHRFFTSKNRFKGRQVTIVGPPVWHLTKVLRVRAGHQVILFTGGKEEFLVEVTKVDKNRILGQVLKKRAPRTEPAMHLTLVQSLPKEKPFDLILQKAVELGVSHVVPLFTERTVPKRSALRERNRLERWEQIVIEAAAQCGRTTVPTVGEDQSLAEFLEARDSQNLLVLFDSREATEGLSAEQKAPRKLEFVCGPEGGFTDSERALLREAGARAFALGPRTLRTETAALAGLALLQYLYGDLTAAGREEDWVDV